MISLLECLSFISSMCFIVCLVVCVCPVFFSFSFSDYLSVSVSFFLYVSLSTKQWHVNLHLQRYLCMRLYFKVKFKNKNRFILVPFQILLHCRKHNITMSKYFSSFKGVKCYQRKKEIGKFGFLCSIKLLQRKQFFKFFYLEHFFLQKFLQNLRKVDKCHVCSISKIRLFVTRNNLPTNQRELIKFGFPFQSLTMP